MGVVMLRGLVAALLASLLITSCALCGTRPTVPLEARSVLVQVEVDSWVSLLEGLDPSLELICLSASSKGVPSVFRLPFSRVLSWRRMKGSEERAWARVLVRIHPKRDVSLLNLLRSGARFEHTGWIEKSDGRISCRFVDQPAKAGPTKPHADQH